MTPQSAEIGSFNLKDRHPRDLAWDGEHLWMMDSLGIIKEFTTEGVLVDSIPKLLTAGWGLTYGAGHLWASNPSTDMIYKVSSVSTDVINRELDLKIPQVFRLGQSFPNPFIEKTTVRYQILKESQVTFRIYSITGQLIKTLVDEKQLPGHYIIEWNGGDEDGMKVKAGVYFYKLETEQFRSMKKTILLR